MRLESSHVHLSTCYSTSCQSGTYDIHVLPISVQVSGGFSERHIVDRSRQISSPDPRINKDAR